VPFNLLKCLLLGCALGAAAHAQFKEIKAAPFPPAAARQKIQALLENADGSNRDATVQKLLSWIDWYRDILDDELIAHWGAEGRDRLRLLMAPLADARVASGVVAYSWAHRPEAWTLENAAVLGDLMARYPASAKPFLDDMGGSGTPQLSPAEAAAVCRILIDMPDIGTWRKTALQILPRYRPVAESLLRQDINGPDQEAMYRALRWRSDLKFDAADNAGQKRPMTESRAQRPHIVGEFADRGAGQAVYRGPMAGTFESTGGPIPQNAEYVFPNVPPVKLLLDFDTKKWEARLQAGEGNTQVLVLRNVSRGPQKRCVVRWTVIE